MPKIMFMTTKEEKKHGVYKNNQGEIPDEERGEYSKDGRGDNHSV